MSSFLTDLWQDLREKRLWPVAALLVLAVAAVPALLLQPSAPEESAPPAAAPPASAAGAAGPGTVVALADEPSGGDSRLDRFDPKDPFEPTGSGAPKPDAGQPPAQSASGGGGDDGDDAGSAGTPASGAAPSTGDGGGSSPVAGGGSGPPAQQPSEPEVKLYTYEIDVSFGRRGDERRRRGIDRMEMLPNEDRPLLLFLGTSASGRSATFLVDQNLRQDGEGSCDPSPRECSVLSLRDHPDHDLHFFTDAQDRHYSLRLLDIRLVPIEDPEQPEEPASESSRRRRSHAWAFGLGAFADVVR